MREMLLFGIPTDIWGPVRKKLLSRLGTGLRNLLGEFPEAVSAVGDTEESRSKPGLGMLTWPGARDDFSKKPKEGLRQSLTIGP